MAPEVARDIAAWRVAHEAFFDARVAYAEFQNTSRDGPQVASEAEQRAMAAYRRALDQLTAAGEAIVGHCAAAGIDFRPIRHRLRSPLSGRFALDDDADDVVDLLESRARASEKNGPREVPPAPPILVIVRKANAKPVARLNNVRYPISEPQADYLQALLDAEGGWYAPPRGTSNRPDRIKSKLPQPIRDIIISSPHYGSRIPCAVTETVRK